MKPSLAFVAAVVAVVWVGSGCNRPKAGAGEPSSSSTRTPFAAIPKSRACASLARTECFRSEHCFLEWVAVSKYTCRDRQGPCETGLHQADRKGCEARPGCEWIQPSCYCPFPGYGDTTVPEPDGDKAGGECACGGGAPARCVVRGDAAPPATR